MSNEDMAYIARRPCGCVAMATVDKPEYAADNAKEIGKCMRLGYTIERVTCEQVRTTHWLGRCDVCKPVTKASRTRQRNKAERERLASGQQELGL